jgi:hypothetical protein
MSGQWPTAGPLPIWTDQLRSACRIRDAAVGHLADRVPVSLPTPAPPPGRQLAGQAEAARPGR